MGQDPGLIPALAMVPGPPERTGRAVAVCTDSERSQKSPNRKMIWKKPTLRATDVFMISF